MKRTICLILSIIMALSFFAGCQAEPSVSADPQTTTDSPQSSETEQMPMDTLEFDFTLESIRVVVDGIVHNFDVQVTDGVWYISAEDAQTAFGGNFAEEYVDLDAYAQSADIRYKQDEVLTAAYFSTYERHDEPEAGSADFERAITLGLVSEDVRERKDEQIRTSEFRAILVDLIEQLAPETMPQFDENVTDYDELMHRGSGFVMAFYAAQCIGADYFNNDFDNTRLDGSDFMNDWPEKFSRLYPHVGEGPVLCGPEGAAEEDKNQWDDGIAASNLWVIWHSSPVSGEMMFSFDEEANSIHQLDPLTLEDAVCAVTRLYDTVAGRKLESVDDPTVVNASENILTAELLAKAKGAPAVTADNHPVWTGFAMGAEYSKSLHDQSSKMQQAADWGFNSVRLNVDYEAFFNYDATAADAAMLELLDKQVASAINNNLHLNLCLTTLPGRTAIIHSDYTSEGDLDLFINPEKQEMAVRLWEILAQRYRDVPNAYLSFTPFFEAFNNNLSSGLPAPDYTFGDIGVFAAKVSDAIHTMDEQRLIIIEVDGVYDEQLRTENWMEILNAIGDRSNVLYNYNYVSSHYVYANMTATEGEHIDNNNHSFSLVDYPTVWPCLSPYIIDKTAGMEDALNAWPIEWNSEEDKNLTLEGLLPAGTVVDLYLYATLGGSIVIKADGAVIYEETLGDAGYDRSEMISQYIQYSTTDKKISVILEQNVDVLEISAVGGAFFWSGLELTMPEEYAKEDWYFATAYDVFLGLAEKPGMTKMRTSSIRLWPYEEFDRGRHAVIHENLTYTTDGVFRESNADTISAALVAMATSTPGAVVRYEDACFAAVKADSQLRYYADILSALTENGLGWWSNDWFGICGQRDIAEAEYARYGGCVGDLYVELLQLLQQYQNTERP